MPEPSLLPERIFGLSTGDGRRAVRPGEVVRFVFRAENGSERATPPARLLLILPPGWTPLGTSEAALPSLAAAAEYTVTFEARCEVADATTADSPVQAALHLETFVLGTNVVRMRVFGQPRLDGPASGIGIEATGDGALRVAVRVCNDGDAAAHNVRVTVPVPPGFTAEPAATTGECASLPAGETLAFGYTMRPQAPVAATVCIDDAYAVHDGGRAALETRVQALLGPAIAAPDVVAERRANRLDLRVRIVNDGWVAARDVRCELELPPQWRVLRGTICADAAPAAARGGETAERGVAVALPLVPARGSVELSLVASSSRSHAGGEVIVRCAAYAVACAIPAPVRRELRIDARADTAFARPGGRVTIAVDVHNAGDTVERVSVGVGERRYWGGELQAAAATAFVAHVDVPRDAGDGDALPVEVAAHADDGRCLATARLMLRLIGGPPLALASEPTGAPARTAAPAIDARLFAAAAARYGERLDVRLRVRAETAVQILRIRPLPHARAVYVPGSSNVNGHAVLDGSAGPPLFADAGLALHDVASGTDVEIAWSLLPRAPGILTVEVALEADGTGVRPAPLEIAIADAPPFRARPKGLPFHIDAATVGDADGGSPSTGIDALPPAPEPSEPDAWTLAAPAGLPPLDAGRAAAIGRVLRGARGPGLLGHVAALAALLPGPAGPLADAAGNSWETLRSVYERLFVKLRIPAYPVTPVDLEDAAGRGALLALLERAPELGAEAVCLRAAPLGGPATFAALAALLARTGAAASVLDTYASRLAESCARDPQVPPGDFPAYLAAQSPDELDAARSAAVAALDAVAAAAA